MHILVERQINHPSVLSNEQIAHLDLILTDIPVKMNQRGQNIFGTYIRKVNLLQSLNDKVNIIGRLNRLDIARMNFFRVLDQ